MSAKKILISICLLGFTACTAEQPQYIVTPGPVTETGTLTLTGVSLVRRGTHVLNVNGQALYYLESKNQDLQPFETHRVVVSGQQQNNTDTKYLPVIIVDQIRSLDGDTTGTHEWKIPAFNISLKTPMNWQANLTGNTAIFQTPGSSHPPLTIVSKTDASLPNGSAVNIGGKKAVSIIQSGSLFEQDIYIADGSHALLFDFITDTSSGSTIDSTVQSAANISFLQSNLTFLQDTASSSMVTGTGSAAANTPCGGPAGVLCPAGYYCEISDTKTNIGKCRSK